MYPDVMKIRRDLVARHMDVAGKAVLEIGAFDRPLYRSPEVELRVLDYLDTDSLIALAEQSEGRDPRNIPCVDYIMKSRHVWLDVDRTFDLIVCNHVVEHIPNLLEWLCDIHKLVKPNGRLLFSLPDRRYTFDYLRRETTVIDLLRAYSESQGKPDFWQILDSTYFFRSVTGVEGWHPEILQERLQTKPNTLTSALQQAKAQSALPYRDTHCSVFTRDGFVALFAELKTAGLLPFNLDEVTEVERGSIEFQAILSRDEKFIVLPSEVEGLRIIQAEPLFFMHIGKTAGTYLNQCFSHAFGPEKALSYCDLLIGPFYENPHGDHFEGKIVISGHVYLADWAEFCRREGYKTKLVTVLRSPLHQLVSSMRFLDGFNYPEKHAELELLDKEIQKIVLRLASVDFQDAGSIDEFLTNLSPHGLMIFDNHQSRFFLCKERGAIGEYIPPTAPIALNMQPRLIKTFEQFSVVGLAERLPETIRMLSTLVGRPVSTLESRINESVSKRQINLEDEWIRRALSKRLIVDDWLYRHAVIAFEKRMHQTGLGKSGDVSG